MLRKKRAANCLLILCVIFSSILYADTNNIILNNQLKKNISVRFHNFSCIAPHNSSLTEKNIISSGSTKNFIVHGTPKDCEAESSGDSILQGAPAQVPNFGLHITTPEGKKLSTRCSYWPTGASERSWHYQCTPSKGDGISITSMDENSQISLNICDNEAGC